MNTSSETQQRIAWIRKRFLEAAGPEQTAGVKRFFRDGVAVPPGVSALDATGAQTPMSAVVVIVTDDDPVLDPVFALRDRLDDHAFKQAWQIEPPLRWSFIGHPAEPLALMRLDIAATVSWPRPGGPAAPQRIERAFVLDPFQLPAGLLRRFSQPGCWMCLIPQSVMLREQQRAGPGSFNDTMSRCLPIGQVTGVVQSIEQALAYVTAHTTPPPPTAGGGTIRR